MNSRLKGVLNCPACSPRGPGWYRRYASWSETLARPVPTEPVKKQILDILRRVKSAGKIAGIACGSPQMVADMLSAGFDLATLLSDIRFFQAGMSTLLGETRKARS